MQNLIMESGVEDYTLYIINGGNRYKTIDEKKTIFPKKKTIFQFYSPKFTILETTRRNDFTSLWKWA